MGKVTESLLKGLSGKIGNLVFYQSNGETYVRKAPGKQSNSVKSQTSELKRMSQDVMKQTHAFLKNFRILVQFGFQEWEKGARKPYHAAVSHMSKYAFSFKDDTAWKELDLSLVKFSKGSLLGPENPIAEKVSDGIKFTWKDNSGQAGAKGTDAAFIVLIHEDRKSHRYCLLGAKRFSQTHILDLSVNNLSEKWYAYLAFSQENPWTKKRIFSDMEYLGEVL